MRFIHLADVHLGAVPDRGYPWSARREEEIWDTFRRVITQIQADPVDILLIAGDLFHRQPLHRELVEVAYLFSLIPQTRVYLMAGNHDYLSEESFYREIEFPPNVFLFQSEEPERVKDPILPVYIYGLSYEHQEIVKPLYDEIVPWVEEGEDEDAMHILLAHGGDEKHIPLNPRELSRTGFDYVALGHIHKPDMIIPHYVAYSGALEPIDRGDKGSHGYVLGYTQEGRLRTRFVPFATRSYLDLEIEVSYKDTRYTVEDRAREAIHQAGAANIYCIRLKGQCSLEQLFFFDRLKKVGNILEVIDETRPGYDIPELYERYRGTLIGDFILRFFPRLLEGEEVSVDSLSPVEEKALTYGLLALLETAE